MKKPTAPKVLSGKEVYNLLMSKIEPDLTTEQFQKLKQKYPEETNEEKQMRLKRYKKALEEYDRAFAEYVTGLYESVHNYRKSARKYVEDMAHDSEEKTLLQVEKQILRFN
ncbi:MAG: hypothetical protein WC840_01135 [Candidatus Peribacteraceae bacterium]